MIIKLFHTGPLAVNTYVSHDETKKGFIVDPGGFPERVEEYISQEGITLEYIILTHGHGDHIGGVSEIREKYPDVKLLASKFEQEMLEDPNLNSSIMFFGTPMVVKADRFVDDGDKLAIGNTELTFIHTPGHSPGGICILAKDETGQVCYSGDTLFRLSIGRTDLYGGDMDTLEQSIKTKLYTLPEDIRVLPGHMGTTDIGTEKRYNPFVKDLD